MSILNESRPISILKEKDRSHIYSSISIKSKDISNSNHVVCLGLDLEPFLKKHIDDCSSYISEIESLLMNAGGTKKLQKVHSEILIRLSKV